MSGIALYGGLGMVGGRADGLGRGGNRGVSMGMGVGRGIVGMLRIITLLGSCVGVGGRMMSSVGVMKGLDLKRLGAGGTFCIGWQSEW